MTPRVVWKLLSLAFLGLAVGIPAQEAGAFKVVVNTANPTTEMPRSIVSKMFLKKVSRWTDWDNTAVVAVDQLEKSPVREAFSDTVHKKSVSAIKSYWQRMIFSGRDAPPREVVTDAEVLGLVRGEPGAIGYVSDAAELGDGVKELQVTE